MCKWTWTSVAGTLVITCVVTACADGYPAGEVSSQSPLSSVLDGPDAGPSATAGTDMAPPPTDMPVMDAREPCSQGQMDLCVCQDTGTEGMRTCMFDLESPLDGFFTECTGCPPPSMDTCADGALSGSETDVDCGGAECSPCTLGQACMGDRDCDTGNCMAFQCAEPAPPGDTGGGTAGTGGSGTAGTGSTPPATSNDCRMNTSLCMGPLECCNAQGMCGIGIAPLCL